MAEITYIKNEVHYGKVLQAALQAKRMLWIGTADLKDLYVNLESSTSATWYLFAYFYFNKRTLIVYMY